MARKGEKDRGIFFKSRPTGEAVGPQGRRGKWWARWYDANGGEHREKAGTKSLALDLFRRRKTEVRQLVKFAETMRQRDVRLNDLVAESGLPRHASTKMSERYLHVTRADLRAAVEAGQPSPTATGTATEVEALLQAIDSQATH